MNESDLNVLLQDVLVKIRDSEMGSKEWWYFKGLAEGLLNEIYKTPVNTRRQIMNDISIKMKER